MKNRLQTLRSTLLLIVLMFIAPVCLAQEYEYADFMEDNVFYKILEDSTTVEVCFQNSFGAVYVYSYSGDVVIPSKVTHDGKTYDVIGISGGAFYMCDITSLSIPNSLQYIEAGAEYQSWAPGGSYTSFVGTFQGCSNFNKVIINDLAAWCNIDFGTNPLTIAHHLYFIDSEITDLVLPNTLSVIKENAFSGCTGLTSITIPSSITSINAGAFEGCSNLTKVNISSIESWCQISFSSESSSPLYYAQHLYLNGEEVTDLNIPSTVTSIGSCAFYGYSSLESVRIPSSVTSIGYSAFYNCSALTELTIDDGLKTIEGSAFAGCTALNRVLIPNSVNSIGSGAFQGCTNLTELSIGNSVSTIGSNAFEKCSGLMSVIIPNSISDLGGYAFSGCTGLTSVVIPNSVTSLGNYAFYGCSNISTVVIGDGVTSVNYGTFSGCSSLENLTIGALVNRILSSSFTGCNNIKTLAWNAKNCTSMEGLSFPNLEFVTIGEEVEDLPANFVKGSKITEVVIPDQVKSIPNSAFKDCTSLIRTTIGNSVSTINQNAFSGCTGLKAICFNAIECGDFSSGLFPSTIEEIVIGDNVKRIPNYFAYSCQGLSSVLISNSVVSIGKYAFSGCTGIRNVSIGSSVTSIGSTVFEGCSGVKSVYFNAENCNDFTSSIFPKTTEEFIIGETVKRIPAYFANGCTSLNIINIPDAVTTIGSNAFNGCTGLTNVCIGKSVTTINSYAFSNCTALTIMTCKAIEPPTLVGSYVFYQVSSDMVVFVPVSSVSIYQEANGWKEFEICSISDELSLIVNLPENINVEDYNQLQLYINSTDGNKTSHYTITDKTSYKFYGIEQNSSWDVTLINQYGDEYGKIENVEVGEEDVSVSFPSLKKPQTVTLAVKLSSGQDVTDQAKVSWKDENGELLVQGNQIAGLLAGRILIYSVTLPQGLATAYFLPANMTYTVKDGDNTVVCQLTAITHTQLSGKVKEATTNMPLYGASVSATQTFAGGNTKTITATTDNQGVYNLDALTAPTKLTVAAQGYITQTVDCDDLMTGDSNVTLSDVALNPITGAVVNVNLTYTPAHSEDESAETQNWYSDYNNVDYEVYNKTSSRAITDISVQYPQIVLMEDVNDGDELELTASSRKGAFNPVKTTATIAEQKATAIFDIMELGSVTATFNKNINPKVVGILYDTDNKLVKSADYSNGSLTIDDLPDGNYRLITMGKSDFFNSIYDLNQFAATGLQVNEDFVESVVNIKSGSISKVTIDEVPFFDESKFYYTEYPTSFSVNKPNIVIGNYLTFRSRIDFKDIYNDMVSDVQLIIDLPESCFLYENSVLVGTTEGVYTLNGNRITIPMSDFDDVVRFCAIPTVSGDFFPSAYIKFKLIGNDDYITQPIGNAPFTADIMSINVPSKTAKTTILVSGTATGVCDINIYDNEVLIGHTKSLANGSWMTNCELYKPYNMSRHEIYAKVITPHGLELLTEMVETTYDRNWVIVSSATQYNEQRGPTPYLITFDFLNPSATSQHYSYDMYDNHRTFTYTIIFTNNQAVSNVMLYVRTAKNHWWPLEATYDEQKDLWITAGEFGNSQNADLPVNIAVDYICTNDEPIDNTAAFDEEMSNLEEINRFSAEQISNNVELSLVKDEDSYSEFKLNGGRSQESLQMRLDSLDYNEAYSLLSEYQFTFAEDSIGYFCVRDTIIGTSYEVTIIDTREECAWKLRMDSLNICKNDSTIKKAVKNSWVKNAINAFKNQNGDILCNGLEVFNLFNDVLGFNKYAECAGKNSAFKVWVDMLEEYDDWDIEMRDAALKSIIAQCPNGEYKIDKENREILSNRLLQVEGVADNFHRKYIEFLTKYHDALFNSVIYDVGINLVSFGIGKLIGKGTYAGKIMKNSKNANYFQFILPTKNPLTRDRVANSLSLGACMLFESISEIFNPEANDFQAISRDFGEWAPLQQDGIMKAYLRLIEDAKSLYNNCESNDEDAESMYSGQLYPGPDMTFCIDPSGFVYEGVPSNRLQGVTATCYFKETVEDMYGDTHEEVVLWDAEQYGQENPLLTDENGYYRWDVPIGMWQVKYEKVGYETTYSDWLPVPPPQLDVNIGMVQMRQPEVIKARAYPQAVEFEFDKYMLPETLTSDNITVSVNGAAVGGTIEMLNAEVDDPTAITSIRRAPGTGLTLASRVRFNANSPFNADQVTLHVKQEVKNYADLQMAEDYVVTLPIEYEMEEIVADSTINVLYGDSRAMTVTVLPAMASKGKTLNVRTASPMIISTDTETYTLDNNGQAVVTVHGDLPGMGSLLFGVDGYDLSAATLVNVMMESEMTVATPAASIASGSEVEKGTAVYLYCKTEGATIYYTLDGSCPCDNTPARMVYDGSPIIINANMTIKAMATAPDLYDSDVATFVYRVSSGLRGDVNGDGEVNIADINALIDIILGGNTNEDTRARADVNGDGEVNIADINAVLDIILSPSNRIRLKVNRNDLLHMDDVTMRPGDVCILNVTLDDANRYSAMQCDIVLPAGLTLLGVSSMDGHISRADAMDENVSRVVDYSLGKRPFVGDGFPVLTMTVQADAALAPKSDITLTNVVLADADNKAWRVADCTARVNNSTGVNDLTAGAERVWVEGHTLCIEGRQAGIARISAINGITYDLDVKAGVNRFDLEAGVYVVVINGKGYKIVVK